MPPEISLNEFVLRICLLGGFYISLGPRTIRDDAWMLQRAKTLVKVLALAPEHRLHREQVMELLWPETALKNASNSLHQVLHAARYALEQVTATTANYLQFQGEMLSLTTQQSLWIDVEAFETAAAFARSSQDPVAFRTALTLYSGDLLPEDLYEDWTTLRRDLLRQTYLGLMTGLAQLLETRHEYSEAITHLERLLRLDPTHEEGHAALMRILALIGQAQIALAQYQTLTRVLQQELGTRPQPATQRLFQDILDGRFSPETQHSLLQHDGNVSQIKGMMSSALSEKEFPVTNLPIPVNSFIGRSREVDEISNLLKRTRLITITGVGGSGKTRLALQIAGGLLQSYPDGVWLIELASLRQSTLVLETLAQVLGLPEQSERPLMDSLIAFLKPKQVLLVLDNCEHLIDSCAILVKVLAQTCPHVCLLCTSREPLHNPGEVIWRISSLSLPDIKQVPNSDEISLSESVQLFVDRARTVLPDFTLNEKNAPAVAQICRRLDGLPLALELAAARVTVLSTEQITERLDNCFSLLTTGSRTALTRQQTLKATLDWSYDLLSDQERSLFRRLAVFAGGFDLDAVSALENNKEEEVLDLLASLVDKSLVLAEEWSGQVRYHLLEPVRQYAEYWLGRSGEAKHVRRRHRDWFLARVEQANNALGDTHHNFWVAYLELELDNLRAALGWCLREPGEEIAGILLANELWQFWLLRGYFVEGRRWLDLCLQQTSDPTALQAETLLHAYALSIRQAEFAAASGQNMVEKSLFIYRILKDTQGINSALQMYGIQAYMASDFVRARSSFSESRDLAQKEGQGFDYALAMYSLGIVAQAQGDLTSARQHLEESLTLLRGLDDQQGITFSMLNLASFELPFNGNGQTLMVDEETWVLLRTLRTMAASGYMLANLATLSRLEGTSTHAHSLLEESFELFLRIGDKDGFGQVLGQIGNLFRSEGSYELAHAFLERSLAVRQELGDHRGIGRTLNNLGVLAMVEGFYQKAQALFEQSMSHFAATGDTVGIAATTDNQGHLALFERDYRLARIRYTESRVIYQKRGDLIRGSAAPTMHYGLAAQAAGDFVAARSSFEESLDLYTQLGDNRGIDRLQRLLANLEQAI